jgi:hypothetical protein
VRWWRRQGPVREEVVGALVRYAGGTGDARTPPPPPDATARELAAALAAIHRCHEHTVHGAQGVTEVAGSIRSTRGAKRRMNSAMPAILADVEELQRQVHRLEALRDR